MSVQLRDLVHHVIDGVHEELYQLVTRTLPTLPFEQRRTTLSAYIHRARRQLCQLLVIIEWRQRHCQAYDTIQDTMGFVAAQQKELTLVTDKFFWLHDDLFRKRVASGPYDVPTAIDVLGYGAFPRLPKEVQLGKKSTRGDFTLKEMEHAIRSRMVIQDPLPSAYSSVEVASGMLRLTEPHHFSLTLSLGDTDPVAATWHVLGLSLLLDDAIPEQAPRLPPLEGRFQRQVLGLIGQLLKDSPSPLQSTYELCHSLCVELQLATLALQAEALAAGDWSTQLTVKTHNSPEEKAVLDLCFWPYEANSRTDALWREFLSDDSAAMAGEEAAAAHREDAEVLQVANHPPLPARCCYLRLRVSKADGLARLDASLGVGADSDAATVPCLDLAFDPSRLTVQDLLYKATSVLLPWKVSLLYRALRQLTPLWPSLQTHLHTEHHGIRLALFETRVSMTVNVKTGTYVVTSNMSSAASVSCLEEFQKALNFVDLGEEKLREPFTQLLRMVIVDELSRTAMALKLYPNRRWAQLLPLLNAEDGRSSTTSNLGPVHLALQLPSASSSAMHRATTGSLAADGGPGMAEEQEEEEEWSLLGLGVKDDMSLEACLILASGDARNTLPRLQSQTPLEPVAHALQALSDGKQDAFTANGWPASLPASDNSNSSTGPASSSTSLLPFQQALSQAAALALRLIDKERLLVAAKDFSPLQYLVWPPSALVDLACGRAIRLTPDTPDGPPDRPRDVSLRCQASHDPAAASSATGGMLTWHWSWTHPTLAAMAAGLAPQQAFTSRDPGFPACDFLYQGGGQMTITFQPGWRPLPMLTALANSDTGLRQLAAFRQGLGPAAASLGLSMASPASFYQVVLSGDALGAASPLAIRHLGLRPSQAHMHPQADGGSAGQKLVGVRGSMSEGGPFCLAFQGELEASSGGVAWTAIQALYNRTRDLSTLVLQVRQLAGPLATVMRASRRHWGSDAVPQLVPWSTDTMAISPPRGEAAASERKAVLLRVEEGGAVVVLARVDEKQASRGRRMPAAEMTEEVVVDEFRDWLD